MIMQIYKRLSRLKPQFKQAVLLLVIGYWLLVTGVFAMDVDLWNLPMPPQSQKSWEDKAIDVNNINAHATRLTCELPAGEITAFYKDMLLKRGWQIGEVGETYKHQEVTGFTKDGRFLYVAVITRGQSNDIYLVSSPQDLRVCRMLTEYFFKEEMAPDAPGRDLPDVPRYPASRRRLGIITQYEAAHVLYETDAKPGEIGSFYRKVLPGYGWELYPGLEPEFLKSFNQLKGKIEDIALLFFERGEDTLYILAYLTPPGVSKARTLIAITKNLGNELYPEEAQGE